MYAEGYGQFALGREHFLQLGHAVSRCADCTECTVQCPLGVHVAARVQHAQELFA
jgi:heterodisulfide reductase subunit C